MHYHRWELNLGRLMGSIQTVAREYVRVFGREEK